MWKKIYKTVLRKKVVERMKIWHFTLKLEETGTCVKKDLQSTRPFFKKKWETKWRSEAYKMVNEFIKQNQ